MEKKNLNITYGNCQDLQVNQLSIISIRQNQSNIDGIVPGGASVIL